MTSWKPEYDFLGPECACIIDIIHEIKKNLNKCFGTYVPCTVTCNLLKVLQKTVICIKQFWFVDNLILPVSIICDSWETGIWLSGIEMCMHYFDIIHKIKKKCFDTYHYIDGFPLENMHGEPSHSDSANTTSWYFSVLRDSYINLFQALYNGLFIVSQMLFTAWRE